MKNVHSFVLDDLKEAIKRDISESSRCLEVEDNSAFKNHCFFTAGGEVGVLCSSNVIWKEMCAETNFLFNGLHNNRQSS